MKNIILINTLIIFLLVSCKSYSNNNPNINHETIIKIKESVAKTLSSQIGLDLHNYPANRDIDVLVGALKSHKNLYFLLIDYPKSIKRQNKEIFIITNSLGNFPILNYYEYKSLPKFFDRNVQAELEKAFVKETFVKEKITLSKEKGQQKEKASPQSEALNKLAIKKLVSSIKNYIAQDNTLKQQFTLPFTAEITVDEYRLILDGEFTIAKLISKNGKHTMFAWITQKDENGKELNEYEFEKRSTDGARSEAKRMMDFSYIKLIDIK